MTEVKLPLFQNKRSAACKKYAFWQLYNATDFIFTKIEV